jgi:two-component system, NarL family, response regulator DesR
VGTTPIDHNTLSSGARPLRENRGRASPPRPLDILLVDDDRLASYGLWALLNWRRGIRVGATAETSSEALSVIERRRPDVCLVSAALGPGGGIRLASELKRLAASPRVIVYADHLGAPLVGAAAIAGADGVVWRYGDPDELAQLIARVAAGKASRPALAHGAIAEVIDRVEDRDRSIAAMLLLSTPPDEIARTLGISARSFQARRRAILERLEDSRKDDPPPDVTARTKPLRVRASAAPRTAGPAAMRRAA